MGNLVFFIGCLALPIVAAIALIFLGPGKKPPEGYPFQVGD
jgi:hypothetical protein